MQTLQVSLEEVAQMGPTYILNEAGYEWSAGALLQWLRQQFPTHLDLPVYMLRPRIGDRGAIYAVDPTGEVLSAVPLYWIERRLPSVPAPWVTGRLMRMEADREVVPVEARTPQHRIALAREGRCQRSRTV
jgi:hypothetical protein